MSEPVFEAFARIRPQLDPSFRAEAQQQIQGALTGLNPRQQALSDKYGLTATLQQNRQLASQIDATNASAQRLVETQNQVGRSGTATFVAGAAKVGLYGLAINTAYQASRALREGLDQTGAAAFTTEGRFRNFGAALVSGDIVGGIQAIREMPKTFQDLGLSITDVTRNYEGFKQLATTDNPFKQLAIDAVAAADSIRIAEASINAMNFAMRESNTLASGAIVSVGTSPNDRGGPLGVGGVSQGNASAALNAARTDVTATSATSSAIRASLALRDESLKNDLAAAVADRNVIDARNKNLKGVLDGKAQRYAELVAANTRIAQIEGQIRREDEAAAATAKAAAASAFALAQAEAARAKAERDRINAANAARLERQLLAARDLRESRLANNESKAALTERKSDDRKAILATISYHREQAAIFRRAGKGTEAENARKEVIAARGRLADLDPAKVAGADGDQLRRLRLANQEARAALTVRKTDDRKAINATISYWQGQARSLREAGKLIEAETAKSAVIAARGRLAALANVKKVTEGGNGTTAFELLQGAASRFSGGNLIGRDQPFAGPTGFTADLAQYLRRMTDALERNTGATNGNTVTRRNFPVQGATSDRAFWEARNARAAVEASG